MSRSLFEYQKPGHVPANGLEREQFQRARDAGAKFLDAMLFGKLARMSQDGSDDVVLTLDRGTVNRLRARGLVRVGATGIVIPIGLPTLRVVR